MSVHPWKFYFPPIPLVIVGAGLLAFIFFFFDVAIRTFIPLPLLIGIGSAIGMGILALLKLKEVIKLDDMVVSIIALIFWGLIGSLLIVAINFIPLNREATTHQVEIVHQSVITGSASNGATSSKLRIRHRNVVRWLPVGRLNSQNSTTIETRKGLLGFEVWTGGYTDLFEF